MVGNVNANMAMQAYKNMAQIASGTATGGETDETGSGDSSGGVSFSNILQKNIQGAIDVMKKGEEMSAQAVTGKADLTDIIQAVTSAELTLQTVTGIRDRMISAYQDIMRMPI